MKSDAQRQAEYQVRQTGKGKARLNCWIAGDTKQAIAELATQHGKTIADIIDLGIAAAANLLHGRLTVARVPAKPSASIIIRKLQERPQAPDQVNGKTDATTPPESPPIAQQHEPEQAIDDADARIRAAAFVVEP